MGTMDFLGKATLNASSVTISSIPSGYSNLRLYFYFKRGTGVPLPYAYLTINGVTAADYYSIRGGNMNNAARTTGANDSRIPLYEESLDSTSDVTKFGYINFYQHNRSIDKSGMIQSGSIGFEQMMQTGFRADINSALTSITLYTNAGSFTSGEMLLYGLE